MFAFQCVIYLTPAEIVIFHIFLPVPDSYEVTPLTFNQRSVRPKRPHNNVPSRQAVSIKWESERGTIRSELTVGHSHYSWRELLCHYERNIYNYPSFNKWMLQNDKNRRMTSRVGVTFCSAFETKFWKWIEEIKKDEKIPAMQRSQGPCSHVRARFLPVPLL